MSIKTLKSALSNAGASTSCSMWVKIGQKDIHKQLNINIHRLNLTARIQEGVSHEVKEAKSRNHNKPVVHKVPLPTNCIKLVLFHLPHYATKTSKDERNISSSTT